MYTKENEAGSIYLSKNIIGNIVINAVDKLGGKAILCSPKGKATSSEKKNMTFMEVRVDDDGLVIKVFILMKFGAGVSAVTSAIIASVNEQVKTVLGQEPKNISIVIKGVVSKNVSKRNIEVSRNEL